MHATLLQAIESFRQRLHCAHIPLALHRDGLARSLNPEVCLLRQPATQQTYNGALSTSPAESTRRRLLEEQGTVASNANARAWLAAIASHGTRKIVWQACATGSSRRAWDVGRDTSTSRASTVAGKVGWLEHKRPTIRRLNARCTERVGRLRTDKGAAGTRRGAASLAREGGGRGKRRHTAKMRGNSSEDTPVAR